MRRTIPANEMPRGSRSKIDDAVKFKAEMKYSRDLSDSMGRISPKGFLTLNFLVAAIL
jgi:hypothetical protein